MNFIKAAIGIYVFIFSVILIKSSIDNDENSVAITLLPFALGSLILILGI